MTNSQDNSDQWKLDKQKLMRVFLDGEIAKFYSYLNILEQTLNVKGQEVFKNIDRVSRDIASSGRDDSKRKELINLKVESEQVKDFSNLLRQSFLTSLYSFMELWIVRECYLDSKYRDDGKSFNQLREKGIEKAKKYRLRFINDDFPFDTNQDWQWIKKFKLLRDCIIHRQGSLTGFSDFTVNDDLKTFVQNESGLILFGVNDHQIFIEHEFCIKALNIVHRFVQEFLSFYTENV